MLRLEFLHRFARLCEFRLHLAQFLGHNPGLLATGQFDLRLGLTDLLLERGDLAVVDLDIALGAEDAAFEIERPPFSETHAIPPENRWAAASPR